MSSGGKPGARSYVEKVLDETSRTYLRLAILNSTYYPRVEDWKQVQKSKVSPRHKQPRSKKARKLNMTLNNQGGKKKPLKAPKKETTELTEDDVQLKAKLKADKTAEEEAKKALLAKKKKNK